MPPRRDNLKGLHFGKWTVQEFSHINSSRSAYWNVTCECGNTNVISALSLKKKESTQCRECSSKNKTAIYNSGNKLEYLYIFKLNSYYKIGVTNDPTQRFKHIDRNSPYKLELVNIYYNKPGLEKEIHTMCKSSQVKGEWFLLTKEELDNVQQTLACSAAGCCEI